MGSRSILPTNTRKSGWEMSRGEDWPTHHNLAARNMEGKYWDLQIARLILKRTINLRTIRKAHNLESCFQMTRAIAWRINVNKEEVLRGILGLMMTVLKNHHPRRTKIRVTQRHL